MPVPGRYHPARRDVASSRPAPDSRRDARKARRRNCNWQAMARLVTGTIQNFEQIADARSAVFGRSIEQLRSLFLRQASFRQPSRDDHPEVSGSQGCATCRLNGQGNTSGSGWHDQNPIFDSVRARTRIFAAGDRLPVFASPVGWRRKLDIVGPIKPASAGFCRKVSGTGDLGECVVADAVDLEPVSASKFPANGEFC